MIDKPTERVENELRCVSEKRNRGGSPRVTRREPPLSQNRRRMASPTLMATMASAAPHRKASAF